MSLAVVREALVQLVGEGIAVRLPNRGFAVPDFSDRRWQQIAEARRTVEPVMLRLAIERGDLDREARVRAAHRRLARPSPYVPEEGEYYTGAWSEAHRVFHRTLLDGCGNPVPLDAFDRLWTAGEPARRWSARRTPGRDGAAEHRRPEEAALSRDADTATEVLTRRLTLTVDALTSAPDKGR
ncbi:GntR family transcriptional regulator [Nonomuraea sp. NPDC049684]|uniref:GntR family transcriptional regulator n=1 Tax=Nonomuraea sp. NPDC049684 TaxID=3364356 RepID=UPI0037AD2383